MNIEETEEVEETLELSTVGLAIHDVLEEIFTPCIGSTIKEEHLIIENKKLEEILKEKFLLHYHDGNIDTGKNYLLYRVALRMIKNYLKTELKEINQRASENNYISVVALEEFLKSELTITTDKDIKVNIKGKADRIDKVDNIYRIIDYKTGKVVPSDLKVNNWSDLLEKPETLKSFQLLCYSWLFFNKDKYAEQLLPSIISFRNPSHGLFRIQHPSSTKGIINRSAIEEFEEKVLKPILMDLYDHTKPFTQTENEDNCSYCPFTVLCGRNL